MTLISGQSRPVQTIVVFIITNFFLNHYLKALAIQTKELAYFLNCLKEIIIFVSNNQSLRQIICAANELN